MSITVREHDLQLDDEDVARYAKRPKIDIQESDTNVLPPSHSLLGIAPPVSEGGQIKFRELDVGISQYIGPQDCRIEGIIKQRFTDFLVFEVDQDANVIHLKSLAKPESPKQDPPAGGSADEVEESAEAPSDPNDPWPERFNVKLSPYLSPDAIHQLKEIFLQGKEPPRVSDNGWGDRPAQASGASETPEPVSDPQTAPSRGRGRGRGRGGRGGRAGHQSREDSRKVLSNPIALKSDRTALHQVVRQLFKGKLDSETVTETESLPDGGSRIAIRWSRSGGRGGRGGGRGGERGSFPPYIHFTLQKTNRDTQDALGHLSRILHVNIKDLGVAGTKDKRGVTVQRVSLKRNGKTVEDIWRLANGQSGQKSFEHALKQRGERGIRIADLNYRRAGLELGMLKGNAFIVTLRNVRADSDSTIERALSSVKDCGFINYYGMQRFGTASVPTHAIGLAILRSEWQQAVSLLLQTRYGEHPEVEAARNAWLVDGDLDRAIALMPRRVVAERCILESYKKMGGDTRNAMGALSTIPRNLRLMYIHAYQSYVWNAIVSDRIHTFGSDKPIVGDIILENDPVVDGVIPMDIDYDEMDMKVEEEKADSEQPSGKNRKPWTPPKVKILTETDLDKYTIFDVVMPLPGTDVAYPGGKLGERYREFLSLDGLDPDNFERKQKEYTLLGSYRKILHLPKEMTWSTLRYTDPDVALAQADEDQLLGFDPPAVCEDGKFTALQIRLTLGTAAYATMALREVTKTETSSHFQANLTVSAEDQLYKKGE